MLITLLGAGMFICFTAYLLPQILKLRRIGVSTQLHAGTPILGALACFLGLFYVSMTGAQFFILLDYSLGLTLNLTYLALILKYRNKNLDNNTDT